MLKKNIFKKIENILKLYDDGTRTYSVDLR